MTLPTAPEFYLSGKELGISSRGGRASSGARLFRQGLQPVRSEERGGGGGKYNESESAIEQHVETRVVTRPWLNRGSAPRRRTAAATRGITSPQLHRANKIQVSPKKMGK